MNIKNNPVTDFFKEIIKPLGLVFGDIGTSPIYTLTIVFLIIGINYKNVMGVVSLIFWTLIMIVTIQYAWLAMSLGREGEGGTIVLREILVHLIKSDKMKTIVTFLTFVGVSLFIGNNIITPAISILSSVEGLVLIPGLENLPLWGMLVIAGIIAFGLFAFQKHGTNKVSKTFGPIMVIWFSWLALSGLGSIISKPEVLMAISPIYAIDFLAHHGFTGFLVLSVIFLCATGGEVLYADMGHLGRKPIIKGWVFVFIALMINYLGQGAFLLVHPETKTTLFGMINSQTDFLYIPFLILTVMATAIASQATISGMFSIIYQGITTRIMPILRVDYTSPDMRSQIYIDSINWFLFIFVIILIFDFKSSVNLGYAYGLAVAGTMTLTAFFMIMIFYLQKKFIHFGISIFIILIDLVYLASNTLKIPEGGYWSLVLASIPLTIILIYNMGQKRLYKKLSPTKLEDFLPVYIDHYNKLSKIQGTALFFARNISFIPPYITRTIIDNDVIYEDNIVISINTTDEPYGVTSSFTRDVAPGLREFVINVGYMEIVDISQILNQHQISVKVIFYGVEDIITSDLRWKIFGVIKSVAPSFVKFYKLPSNKIHGIVSQINM